MMRPVAMTRRSNRRSQKPNAANPFRFKKFICRHPLITAIPYRSRHSTGSQNFGNATWRGVESAEIAIGNTSLRKLRPIARAEILKIAGDYSRQYGDFGIDLDPSQIVMSGHQPSLFHPGVWFKNFALSDLGRRFQCVSLNLLVDNDLCSSTTIHVPRLIDDKATTTSVRFDGPGAAIPFEERAIEDPAVFRDFGKRAERAIQPFVSNPLVNRLWPHVCAASELLTHTGASRVGHSIAAGRHRLEAEIGLKTLELPLGMVSNTEPFAVFAHHIFFEIVRFRESYNSCLLEYRKLYRIRSRSHPVPELAMLDGWTEAPFWVWSTERPGRRRLFVKLAGDSFKLSDLEGWQQAI